MTKRDIMDAIANDTLDALPYCNCSSPVVRWLQDLHGNEYKMCRKCDSLIGDNFGKNMSTDPAYQKQMNEEAKQRLDAVGPGVFCKCEQPLYEDYARQCNRCGCRIRGERTDASDSWVEIPKAVSAAEEAAQRRALDRMVILDVDENGNKTLRPAYPRDLQISKREWFAAMALIGVGTWSPPINNFNRPSGDTREWERQHAMDRRAQHCVQQADAILAALAEGKD